MNPPIETVVNGTPSRASWYALQVRSRKEGYVASQIQGQGYECLLPTYKSVRKWSDRVKEVEQPLFPGYLFCRFDFENRRPVITTPGVLQIVGYGRTAISVSDEEIQALQLAVSSGMPKQPWPYLEVGQRVRVNYGTLSGLEGILVNVKGNHRVILSVTLLQRSVAMEVETSWLSVVKEETRESMTQRILRPLRAPAGI
ncbi:MAG TPA: UpxY family transcription antiterminator [Candidatus Limnocylindrales bacterium]|nr:UpxY family transcription antiterminator [Candidatus Limnocylindrales bacterium]